MTGAWRSGVPRRRGRTARTQASAAASGSRAGGRRQLLDLNEHFRSFGRGLGGDDVPVQRSSLGWRVAALLFGGCAARLTAGRKQYPEGEGDSGTFTHV
jgi:hypothetical protein